MPLLELLALPDVVLEAELALEGGAMLASEMQLAEQMRPGPGGKQPTVFPAYILGGTIHIQ